MLVSNVGRALHWRPTLDATPAGVQRVEDYQPLCHLWPATSVLPFVNAHSWPLRTGRLCACHNDISSTLLTSHLLLRIATTHTYTPKHPLSSSSVAFTRFRCREGGRRTQHFLSSSTHQTPPEIGEKPESPPSLPESSSTRERTHSSLHSPRARRSPSKLAGWLRTSPPGRVQVIFLPLARPSSPPSS